MNAVLTGVWSGIKTVTAKLRSVSGGVWAALAGLVGVIVALISAMGRKQDPTVPAIPEPVRHPTATDVTTAANGKDQGNVSDGYEGTVAVVPAATAAAVELGKIDTVGQTTEPGSAQQAQALAVLINQLPK